MRLIKKLDIYIMKQYLVLFAGTFFICLFVFLMQLVYRYQNDVFNKGIEWDVLLQFFGYAALTLVPSSLPLALLLASLISFGNLGEKLELLSMKAAGIPLIRILQPVMIFALLVSGISFYFQDTISPYATKKMATLVWSMKQKSPEKEITEGIFYSPFTGYNLFVQRKNPESGMLYGVMIYNTVGNSMDIDIVLADSAQIQSTEDNKHIRLSLYSGVRFRNMDGRGGNMLRADVPFMKEAFTHEVDIIEFDNNFNLMDENLFNGNAQVKNLPGLELGIDSLDQLIDSTGHATYEATRMYLMQHAMPAGRTDSLQLVRQAQEQEPFDTLYARLDGHTKQEVWRAALAKSSSGVAEYDFRSLTTSEYNTMLRRHKVEWHKRFTLTLACVFFFFIGAPLGAIIRKGGLGVPIIVSLAIFIFYYIINVSGEKMAKSGEWFIPFGVWLSSMILCPIGAFLTYKANKDSVVFNIEGYRALAYRLLGLRAHRRINRKEVIINDPDYPRLATELRTLVTDCDAYAEGAHLMRMPNYLRLFFRYREDTEVIGLNERLEALVTELANSRDSMILATLNDLPILVPDAHTRPFHRPWLNKACGIALPVGLFFYLRCWRFRLRLWRDMQTIHKDALYIAQRIDEKGAELN